MSQDSPVDDDDLLRALGARGRAQRDRLVAGEGAPARANDPTASARAEVFAPFDAAARARFVAGIQRHTGPGTRPAPAEAETARGGLSRFLARLLGAGPGPRRRAVIWSGAFGVAAAAALVLVMASPGRVPGYALEIAGGDRAQRSGDSHAAPDATPSLSPGSWLEIRARPEHPTRVDDAALFVRARGAAHGTRVAAKPEVSPDGVVRWRGTAAQLLGDERGDLEFRVVLGRAPLPTADEVFAQPPTRDRGTRTLIGSLRVLGE